MPKTPSLKNFRRIVVKVGSLLLVDAGVFTNVEKPALTKRKSKSKA